jgi:hypothetical protein
MNHSLLRGRRNFATLVALTGILCSSALLQAKPDKDDKGNNGNGNGNGTPTASSFLYSGQAIALKIDGVTKPVPGPIVLCDTGSLPVTGGHLQVSQSNFTYAGGALTIEHASAMTSGSGRQAFSASTLSGYRVEFIEDDDPNHHPTRALIEADFISGEASAGVDASGKVVLAGKVVIQNLRVNGEPITVTGQPNQRVELPHGAGGYLILNEQVNSAGADRGDIVVSPIHFFVCHCIEGHVGLVRAGITAGSTPPPSDEDCGKVTGGGWIIGTPSGEKGTFGMSGGIRRGEFWGHLQYNDHGTGMKVHSTAVTGFQFDSRDPNGRIINYNVTINGAPGTATLRVVDNGEPGRNDIFDLTLSTGYHAGGDLGGGRPGGGNIQVHKCPPGWR